MCSSLVLATLLSLTQVARESPPSDGRPIRVEVGIFVNDLILIEEPTHSFMADVAFELAWNDPRLAQPGAAERRMDLDDVWHPEATVLNERRAFAKLPREARVQADGTLRYLQRYTGVFTASFDLRDFPMDRQRLHFDLVFLGVRADQLEIVVNEALTGQREQPSISDWIVEPGSASVATFSPVPGTELPTYTYAIPLQRRTGYYIWKILLPLVLIIGMAGAVFWIDAKNSGPKISVSVSSMLTLIAYRFLLGNLVPRLSYLTRMDHFILGATIMVFSTLIAVVAISNLAGAERYERARSIDRRARVVYPLALIALLVLVFRP